MVMASKEKKSTAIILLNGITFKMTTYDLLLYL